MSKARKKNNPARRKKKSSKTDKSSLRWLKILFIIAGLALVFLALHVWSLNNLIEQRFDGDTWARPSRVFARPLELYAGLSIKPEQIKRELKLAEYQAVRKNTKPGHFSSEGNSLSIYSRDFYFSDHHQSENLIKIRFKGGEIVELKDLTDQKSLDFYQPTPVIMGSYIPGNGEDRLVLAVEDIPETLTDILLAAEDKRFFDHFGVSPLSILRALLANIQAGKTVQGGSTLTQQLAKNLFLTPERSLLRKLNEAVLAVMLEARFSKQAILAAYLNEVFLLQQKNTSIHGFALASKLLFKQPLKYLSKDKLALLVGMVKGPSIYNPLIHPERATKRRNTVLKIMLAHKIITEPEYKKLSIKPLGVVSKLPPVNPFPAYLDLVKKQLTNNYSSSDLAEKGLSIFTAFDPQKQNQLEDGLKSGLKRFDDKTIQAAVIVADYLNGDLLALVGDRHTDFPGFNRAILAQRPIGSLIKPLLLYSFLEEGLTLASMVKDRPIRVRQSDGKVWSPKNYDKKLHGTSTIYNAFIKSYNLPFVHLGLEGNALKSLTTNLEKIHLLKQQIVYPSMLLGATLMTPLEVSQMFQVIASSGYFAPLTTIRLVMDGDHNVLTRIPVHSEELFNRQSMIQVQRALIGVAEEGTARYLQNRYPQKTFAGKTGTTDDLRDSWFAGFSNRYLTVVWLGDDKNNSINLTGSSGALRVWADIMGEFNADSLKLNVDPELEWAYINRLEGGISGESCEDSALMPFIKGAKPGFNSNCEKNYLEKGKNWLQKLF
ncbi:MAG: penicillin-binding protein 1B [Thiotrichaceae bacterium]|nr:penicillin-binding protein 1B [Thiotrichaceae bacterium]